MEKERLSSIHLDSRVSSRSTGTGYYYGSHSNDFKRLEKSGKCSWCGWRELVLILIVIGVVSAVIWWVTGGKESLTTQPVVQQQPLHILFILADDVGWNDVGFHGSDIPTPFIDSLAKEGVVMENYYTLPFSAASRAAFLTGRLPIHTRMQHGQIDNERPHGLPLMYDTLADRLKVLGYSTHLVGKWHLGFFEEEYIPINRGFDSFYGFYGGHEDYFYHNGSGYPFDTEVSGYDFRRDTNVLQDPNFEYSTHLFSQHAIQLIGSHDIENSMFLYVPFQAAQSPVQAPDFYVEKFCSDIIDENRKVTCGAITAMDEAISNITEALKRRDMWDNTIVIFTSANGAVVETDNRGGSNGAFRGGKATLFEGGVKVPAFVHSNLLESNSAENSELMHVCDWFTTLLNIVEDTTEGNIQQRHISLQQSGGIPPDSFDMWPVISRQSNSPRNEVLLNIDDDSYDTFPFGDVSAIRMGPWKLIIGDQLFWGWYGTPGIDNVTYPEEPQEEEEEYEEEEFSEEEEVHEEEEETPESLEEEIDDVEEEFKILRSPKRRKEEEMIWLFNLENDPEERINCADDEPDVVSELLERINDYRGTLTDAWFPEKDDASHPDLHEGVWSSWSN